MKNETTTTTIDGFNFSVFSREGSLLGGILQMDGHTIRCTVEGKEAVKYDGGDWKNLTETETQAVIKAWAWVAA